MANTSEQDFSTDILRGTGPQGHRARMRTRVMSSGANTLADYELLEMLLFLGIPRKDTKPLAKGLIQYFGSLIDVFRAPTRELRNYGLKDETIRILRLPAIAAERLASSENKENPTLSSWEELISYIDSILNISISNQFHILYLDNRNRLLSDEIISDFSDINKKIAIRALYLHATAIIGVYFYPQETLDKFSKTARQLEICLKPLSILTHDILWIISKNKYQSLRNEGLL